MQLTHRGYDGLGAKRKSGAPAGHGVGLRQRAEHDHMLLRLRDGRAGERRFIEDQVRVALIEKQVDATAVRQAHDALQIGARDDGSRGIRRRIEDDGLRSRRDGTFYGFGGHAEVVALGGLQVYDLATRVLNDVLVGDPVGDRQDHLVAMVDQHLDCIEEGELAAGRENSFFRRVVCSEIAGVALDDSLAHLGDARDDGIAREVGFNGGDSRILDVARRREMRFAGAKIDELGALRSAVLRRQR